MSLRRRSDPVRPRGVKARQSPLATAIVSAVSQRTLERLNSNSLAIVVASQAILGLRPQLPLLV
jgi:hypothetical protein